MKRLPYTCLALLIFGFSPAASAIWYVNPAGTGDAPSIEAAIDSADINGGDTIMLAPGTYTGPGNTTVDFNGKPVILTSEEGAESTVIDCANATRGFLFRSHEDSASVLSGLTIMNGAHNFFGGAVLCNNASPKIISNRFIGNFSGFQGGAVYCDSSDAVIRNNVFEQNVALDAGGGVWCSGRSRAEITDNQFIGNVAVNVGGGGVASDASAPMIARNTFIGGVTPNPGGGAIDVSAKSTPIIRHNTFEGNTVTGNGGAIRILSSPPPLDSLVIDSNVFVGNGALFGGAISCESVSSPVIRNNTFDNCWAQSGSGAGIYCHTFSDPLIERNIIVNSTMGNAVETGAFSRPEIGCCDFFGNAGGDGFPVSYVDRGCNFSENPQFCGPIDYHLESTSPCAPGNHPDGIGCQHCGVIGAESVGCVSTGIAKPIVLTKYVLHQNVPNPFNPSTSIVFDVLRQKSKVSLSIFDVSGRLVRTLFDQSPAVGRNAVTWDGRDRFGRDVSSGVYFYRLKSPDYQETRKMVLVR